MALLASTVPESRRAELVNPAVLKQVLVEGADRLPEAGHVYEQGAGRLNVLRSAELLAAYEPRPSFFPATLDLTDCPYMWPHCDQPLYAGAQPVTINVTILNGMGVSSYIVGPPRWVPGSEGERLQPSFSFEPQLWPWSGHLALHLRVPDAHAAWEGRAEGAIEVAIQAEARVRHQPTVGPCAALLTPSTPPPRAQAGESEGRVATISLPVRANVVPTPPRHRRVLWDLFHNVRYPSPFVPRDNLDVLVRAAGGGCCVCAWGVTRARGMSLLPPGPLPISPLDRTTFWTGTPTTRTPTSTVCGGRCARRATSWRCCKATSPASTPPATARCC